jgi:hypothetical protein
MFAGVSSNAGFGPAGASLGGGYRFIEPLIWLIKMITERGPDRRRSDPPEKVIFK